ITEALLKPIVHRADLGALSYPSGHTTAIYCLLAVVIVLLLLPPRPVGAPALRYLVLAAAFALAVIVPISLMGERWHYFTDTVGGAALGVGTVIALAFILDLPVARRWLAAPDRWLHALLKSRG